MNIVAPDIVFAEQWAQKQLESWRKESDFDVEEKERPGE